MWRILFIAIIIVGFALTFSTLHNESLAKEPLIENVLILVTDSTNPIDFRQTGTLVFYPNNVGPVPYLFYTDQRGGTAAKALVFPDSLQNDYSSWSGARISVTGTTVAEHVVVDTITYLSGP